MSALVPSPMAVGTVSEPVLVFLLVAVVGGLLAVHWVRQAALFRSVGNRGDRPTPEELTNCPSCGARVPAEGESCEHCGASFDDA